MINSRIKSKITSYLKRNPLENCSASMISRRLRLNRITVTKYIKILEAQGEIASFQVGMAKVWKLNESPVLATFQDTANGHCVKLVLNSFDHPVTVIDLQKRLQWHNSSHSELS